MPNSNGDKGKRFEQQLCQYLRPWWRDVERSVATGYRTAARTRADRGDVHGIGVPGMTVIIQAKDVTGSHPRGLSGKALNDLLVQTRAQRDAAGAVLGLLVEKRAGHISAGDAWCHLDALELYTLVDGWADARDTRALAGPEFCHLDEHGRVTEPVAPVRLLFRDVVAMLVATGFAPEPVDPPRLVPLSLVTEG